MNNTFISLCSFCGKKKCPIFDETQSITGFTELCEEYTVTCKGNTKTCNFFVPKLYNIIQFILRMIFVLSLFIGINLINIPITIISSFAATLCHVLDKSIEKNAQHKKGV